MWPNHCPSICLPFIKRQPTDKIHLQWQGSGTRWMYLQVKTIKPTVLKFYLFCQEAIANTFEGSLLNATGTQCCEFIFAAQCLPVLNPWKRYYRWTCCFSRATNHLHYKICPSSFPVLKFCTSSYACENGNGRQSTTGFTFWQPLAGRKYTARIFRLALGCRLLPFCSIHGKQVKIMQP